MNATESTPLLTHPRSILSVVHERLRSHEISSVTKESVVALCPTPLTSAEETALVLVVLLQLQVQRAASSSSDVWDQFSQTVQSESDEKRLGEQALKVWLQYAEEWHTNGELVGVLTTRFSLDDMGNSSIALIDLLHRESAPDELLKHPLMSLTVHKLWASGQSSPIPGTSHPFSAVTRLSTPRAMHGLDLIIFILYLVVLVRLVTYPPVVQDPLLSVAGLRQAFIMLYALASLVRPSFHISIPSVLVLLSFLTCFPACPTPGDISYNILLLATVLYLLGLHLPHAPNPVFLFHVKHTVPLSIFLWTGFKRTFLPILSFFIPSILLSIYLLSLSLSETFFQTTQSLTTTAAPIEARTTFLTFVATILILFITSLILSTLNLNHPSLSTHPWDRYSSRVGIESRRTFVRVVAAYSGPRFFPTPVNILPLLFVTLPGRICRLAGWQGERLWRMEEGIWVVFVLPLSTIVAGVWLWGYL